MPREPSSARPDGASDQEPGWGLGDALTALGLGLLLDIVLGGIVVLAWHRPTGPHGKVMAATPGEQALVNVVSLIGIWLGFAAVTLFATRSKGTGSLATDFGFRIKPRVDVPLGIAIGVACQLGLIWLIYLPISHIVKNFQTVMERPAKETLVTTGGIEIAVLGVLVTIGAPIFEELFFRGLLFQALQKRFIPWLGRQWGAVVSIVISAGVFGLVHAEGLQLLGLVALGLVLATATYRTGRVGMAIFIHASFNATAVIQTAMGH